MSGLAACEGRQGCRKSGLAKQVGTCVTGRLRDHDCGWIIGARKQGKSVTIGHKRMQM